MINPTTFGDSSTTDFEDSVEGHSYTQTPPSDDVLFEQRLANDSPYVKANGFDDLALATPPTARTARPSPLSGRDRSPFKLPRLALGLRKQDVSDSPNLSFSSCSTSSNSPRSAPRSPQQSPSKEKSDYFPTLTGDTTGEITLEDKREGLSSWFKGSSAPVTLGVPVKEKPATIESTTRSPSPSKSGPQLHKRSQSQSIFKQAPALASRFSFFGSKATLDKPTENPTDELLNMDINAALFPAGPNESFSPASFKNLEMNAEGALLKLHTAYRIQHSSLHEALSAKDTLQDEVEEAETRAKHLKMQLDNMAVQASEQEQMMKDLAAELDAERSRRQREEGSPKRTVMLVKPSYGTACADDESETTSPARRNVEKRSSRATISTDSGFESEADSCADSVFSRSRSNSSPTGTMSSSSTAGAALDTFDTHSSSIVELPAAVRAQSRLQRSGNLQDALRQDHASTPRTPQVMDACANCSGGTASSAWSAVRDLRSENEDLKQRVVVLEGTVDSCLGMVGGLAM